MSKLTEYLTSQLALAWIATFILFSHQVFADEIAVEDGFVRATIPGTSISSAYMNITNNTDQTISLLGASSDVSQRIEIHQHTMADGMMKMRQVDSISAPARGELILEPSGYHLMIFDLPEPLKNGQHMTFTLHFSGEHDVEISLPIRDIKRKKAMHHH